MNIISTINKKWILKSRPKPGALSNQDFEFIHSAIPTLKEGEFLVKNRMISCDPAQRVWLERDSYMPAIPIDSVVTAMTIGEIVESRNPKFVVGQRVSALFGWEEYSVYSTAKRFPVLPIPAHVSDEAALSIFGMTGLTAFFGMEEIGKPQTGQTVVVSGASGATGSIAAQIAKIRGAKVIGIAGGQEKCAWLTDKALIDAAIDYKNENISQRLRELAPNGVNVFFDNVGGVTLDTVLKHLALNARIVLCGGISGYSGETNSSIHNYMNLISTRSSMQGFLISDFAAKFYEGIAALGNWLREGKIVFEVDVQHGLENAPQTLQRLFDGKNFGKQLLKI
jgi:NADPH-dependent curcumin reductase CurA